MRNLSAILTVLLFFIHAIDLPARPIFHGSVSEDKTLVFDARRGPPTVSVTIDEETYTFLVDPSDTGISLTVNADVSAKHNGKNLNIIGRRQDIEGNKTKVGTGSVNIKIGDFYTNKRQLIHWYEKDYYPPYDGRIGGGLFWKMEKVIFLLSDVKSPQKTFEAPLKKSNHWIVSQVLGEGKALKAWSSFRLHYNLTHTNLLLSQTLKDKSIALADETVFHIDKEFSAKSTLVNSQLAKPISLIRGDVTQIKLQVPEISFNGINDNEIVAKATRKKGKVKERPEIYLGTDYFKGCTSLVFFPQEKRVQLFCDDDK